MGNINGNENMRIIKESNIDRLLRNFDLELDYDNMNFYINHEYLYKYNIHPSFDKIIVNSTHFPLSEDINLIITISNNPKYDDYLLIISNDFRNIYRGEKPLLNLGDISLDKDINDYDIFNLFIFKKEKSKTGSRKKPPSVKTIVVDDSDYDKMMKVWKEALEKELFDKHTRNKWGDFLY